MTDLVKNLRNPDWVKDWFDQAGFQAADRIEELEALLPVAYRLGLEAALHQILFLGCDIRKVSACRNLPTPADLAEQCEKEMKP